MAFPITELPTELLQQITTNLPAKDAWALRQTCRAIERKTFELFRWRFFSRLKLNTNLRVLWTIANGAEKLHEELRNAVKTVVLTLDNDIPVDRDGFIRYFNSREKKRMSGSYGNVFRRLIRHLPNLEAVHIRYAEKSVSTYYERCPPRTENHFPHCSVTASAAFPFYEIVIAAMNANLRSLKVHSLTISSHNLMGSLEKVGLLFRREQDVMDVTRNEIHWCFRRKLWAFRSFVGGGLFVDRTTIGSYHTLSFSDHAEFPVFTGLHLMSFKAEGDIMIEFLEAHKEVLKVLSLKEFELRGSDDITLVFRFLRDNVQLSSLRLRQIYNLGRKLDFSKIKSCTDCVRYDEEHWQEQDEAELDSRPLVTRNEHEIWAKTDEGDNMKEVLDELVQLVDT
ncbi:hypothetical protein LTR66_012894 [Elasticomyces elasticus]|nr:hypothetical protein LTR66_012894 [Elasticomyces elasticus]